MTWKYEGNTFWESREDMISTIWEKYQNRELEMVLNSNKGKIEGDRETFNWLGVNMFFPSPYFLPPSENLKKLFEEIEEPYNYNASFVLDHITDIPLFFNTTEYGLGTWDTVVEASLRTFAPYSEHAVALMEKLFNLQRFLIAQEHVYNQALQEVRDGKKKTHWMWYIFPQMIGLGKSEKSYTYGIEGNWRAKTYISHPILRERLVEICEAVLNNPKSVYEIFGADAIKVRSCVLLFASVSDIPVFRQLKAKYVWK